MSNRHAQGSFACLQHRLDKFQVIRFNKPDHRNGYVELDEVIDDE